MFWIVYRVLLLVSVLYAVPVDDLESNKIEQRGLTTIEFIQREGYRSEEHKNVETSDGYLLDLHRIPHGKYNAGQENKPVVFLMHGLLSSSVDWVNMGSERSIAYQLADAGYDVWMGNARGNTYSRKHINYNPDRDSKFWKFSWHEIGISDLSAMIDYVLKFTNQRKLYYIGHSQGTTSFFVMASERPEYNEKIRLMVALAPVAYMSNVKSLFLQTISRPNKLIEWIFRALGMNEFLPGTGLLTIMGQHFCKNNSLFQEVCANIAFLIAGWDSEQLDRKTIPVILSNYPAGSSVMQFLHYAQEIQSGYFRQYDYGLFKNWLKYGQTSPPNYKIYRISAPVVLIYSENDNLSAVEDVRKLANELPKVTPHLLPYRKFNHLDYLFAIDSRKFVYNDVLEFLKQY